MNNQSPMTVEDLKALLDTHYIKHGALPEKIGITAQELAEINVDYRNKCYKRYLMDKNSARYMTDAGVEFPEFMEPELIVFDDHFYGVPLVEKRVDHE